MEISYFGELGYLCIYLLPEYERHTFHAKCIIHTFRDYANILSSFNKPNVEFVRYDFDKRFRCCAWSDDIKRQNLARILGRIEPLNRIDLIGRLHNCLQYDGGNSCDGKILLFPRMRNEGDYGSYNVSFYENIVESFIKDNKKVVLCGHRLESQNLSKYNLDHLELIDAVNACKTMDLCIIPDSGYASLLIASGVKKIVIIYNEDYSKQRDTYFHLDIYVKTSKWFGTDYYVVSHKRLPEFLNGKYYENSKNKFYIDDAACAKALREKDADTNINFNVVISPAVPVFNWRDDRTLMRQNNYKLKNQQDLADTNNLGKLAENNNDAQKNIRRFNIEKKEDNNAEIKKPKLDDEELKITITNAVVTHGNVTNHKRTSITGTAKACVYINNKTHKKQLSGNDTKLATHRKSMASVM